MIEGIKILLERMKTHPEEFTLVRKWDNLIDQYRHVLTNEEVKAYNDARHELERQKFTEHVLEILLAEKDTTDSFVYNTAGREIWNTSRLELERAQEDRYKELLKLQIAQARQNLK
jgi:hypothetical protein